MNVGVVCIMGVSIVFIGLLCIVLLCRIMSILVGMSEHAGADAPIPPKMAGPASVAPQTTAATTASADPGPRAEIIAAVTAAIAEETGEDFTAIRILSLKKI